MIDKAEEVCDAYQGEEGKFPSYKVAEKDFGTFIDGMVKTQPYQHIVDRGIKSPVGWLVIIKDTMKPKPHIFSLNAEFHIGHTSREHGWTQDEVNKIIKAGK